MASAYASVCSYARIRSQTLIYVRGTLGIRRVCSNLLTYVGVRCIIYAEIKLFLDMFKIYQRLRAYRIYVTHTLTIPTAYAGYARHTLNDNNNFI